jgi:hypothetical protein
MKGGEFLYQLSDNLLLKEDSVPQSHIWTKVNGYISENRTIHSFLTMRCYATLPFCLLDRYIQCSHRLDNHRPLSHRIFRAWEYPDPAALTHYCPANRTLRGRVRGTKHVSSTLMSISYSRGAPCFQKTRFWRLNQGQYIWSAGNVTIKFYITLVKYSSLVIYVRTVESSYCSSIDFRHINPSSNKCR